MTGLLDLYQDLIIDHNCNPRNCGRLEAANCRAEGTNPLCGDSIRLYLDVKNGRIEDVSFECAGCAISRASASLMSESIKGKSVNDAQTLFRSFQSLVTEDSELKRDTEKLGELVALSGVRKFPVRVKCATLAWHALQAALKGEDKAVTTE